MPLNVAIQMDPIEKLDIIGDTSFALGLEAVSYTHLTLPTILLV